MGRKAKDGEPQVIANLWEGVLMYKGLSDGDPLSDWSSLGWIVPFSFCKNNLNTTNPHQAICKHFVLATTFLQVENLPVLTVFVYESVTGQRSRWFQKKPTKPGFANDLGFSGPKFMLKISNNHRVRADQELWDFHLVTKAQVLQPNSSAWEKTTNQISKCAILYPKIAREPHDKLLWFFFLGMETHWVS